jgi:RNA polymerase-binding transcription factor DksA
MHTPEQKEHLEKELVRLEEELSSIAVYDETTGDWVATPDSDELKEADENSEADAVEEWNGRRATLASLEILFHNTKHALERMGAGTFGVCEICNTPIEADRLAVVLTARTCKAHMDEERTLAL